METVATAAGNKNYKLHSRAAGTSETLILTKPLIIEFFPNFEAVLNAIINPKT